MYELATAVFEVTIIEDGKDKVLCVPYAVRLEQGISRGAAIPKAAEQISLRQGTSRVNFKFWCDSWLVIGCGPVSIWPDHCTR